MNWYYVVVVIDDIEPTTIGPYLSRGLRDIEARRQRQMDPALENGVFALDIEDDGARAEMWSFGSSYLEEEIN